MTKEELQEFKRQCAEGAKLKNPLDTAELRIISPDGIPIVSYIGVPNKNRRIIVHNEQLYNQHKNQI